MAEAEAFIRTFNGVPVPKPLSVEDQFGVQRVTALLQAAEARGRQAGLAEATKIAEGVRAITMPDYPGDPCPALRRRIAWAIRQQGQPTPPEDA